MNGVLFPLAAGISKVYCFLSLDSTNQLARCHGKPLGWLSGEEGRDRTAGGLGTNRGLIGASVSLASAIAAFLWLPLLHIPML